VSAARFPGATWAPLPESGSHGRYVKTQLIVHSTGTKASAAANRRYFAQQGIAVESTFLVDYDGGCLQIMEAHERADANTTASKRAISVEMVGEAGEPFTPAQLATLHDIAEWACSNHPIARRQIPEHDQSGVGWHVMFGAPGPWTTVRGKECPGPTRIRQIRDLIIPAVQRPRQEDDTMAGITKEYLDEQFARVGGGPRKRDAAGKVIDGDPGFISVADAYTLVEEAEARLSKRLADAEARLLAAIKAA
jgi:hypothetical protein